MLNLCLFLDKFSNFDISETDSEIALMLSFKLTMAKACLLLDLLIVFKKRYNNFFMHSVGLLGCVWYM